MNELIWKQLLAEQVERNGKLLYRIAFRILRDDATARDVCQQAFLQALKNQSLLDPTGVSLKRWLARTVIRASMEVIRDRKIERRVLGKFAAKQRGQDIAAGPLEEEELREVVLAAIARLPEPMQSVVILRKLQGMTGNEVKELLECSATEVSRQLHQGFEELRRLLSEEPGETSDAG